MTMATRFNSLRPFVLMLLAIGIFTIATACNDSDLPNQQGKDSGTTDGTSNQSDGGDGGVSTGDGGDGASSDGNDGTTPGEDGAQTGDSTTNTDGAANDTWEAGIQASCNGTVYQCSDGKDNDNDGLDDSLDPECMGPCDNDEASFATGVPGDNVDACKQDCFFDGNSGQGNDGCEWNLKCDSKSPGANLTKSCPYDANYKNCPTTQSQLCLDTCQGYTPNGCDCFGCCQVYVKESNQLVAKTIYLGSGAGCTATNWQACAACTQQTSCINDCGECELCLGKGIEDLPSKCFTTTSDGGTDSGTTDGGTTDGGKTDSGTDGGTDGATDGSTTDSGTPKLPTCSLGLPACVTTADCSSGRWCLTGCCISSIE